MPYDDFVKIPPSDSCGWHTFTVGQQIRCPGPRLGQFDRYCGRYMGTVDVGICKVRVAVTRTVNERRSLPRISKVCPHRKGCGSKLEIESMLAEHAA